MATSIHRDEEPERPHPIPLSILLDLGGLEVEARKNILRALESSRAREMRLRAEIWRLRRQLERERMDRHATAAPPGRGVTSAIARKEPTMESRTA